MNVTTEKEPTKAEICKGIRKALGLTMQQMADKLGVNYTTISRWENGHTEPSHLAIDKMIQLAKEIENAKPQD